MPTEKEKWTEKKAWIDLFDSLTPEQLEQERKEAKGLGAKIVATFKEWLFKIMGFVVAPFGWALMWGMEKFSEVFEPELVELSREQLEEMKEVPDLPPTVRKTVEYLLGERSAIHLGFLLPLSIGMLLGIVIGMMRAPMNLGSQFVNEKIRSVYLREDDAVKALFREIQTEDQLRTNLRKRGYHEGEIDALIEVSHFYPSPQDLILWQAREVFEPGMIERYGLDAELGGIERGAFYKAGMTDEQIVNFWRAHWEHASWMQVTEMLHRGHLTDEEVYDWFRLVEIPPFWREKLISISWNVPTRVDVRRWWDMRTIDEERLRSVYQAQGYHDQDLEDYILWTKVYVAFPDLMARFTGGWLTEEEVKQELINLGMPAERVDEMLETKISKAKSEGEEAKESRDFTRSEILDGYRRRLFTEEETRTSLTDLKYAPEQIDFYIDREELKREQELKNAYLTRYKTLYVEGMIAWPDVAEALTALGFGEAEVADLGPVWDLERTYRIAHPSRADLDRFLKADIIDEIRYRDEMRNMGYGDLYIDWYLLRLAQAPAEAVEEEPRLPSRTDLQRFLEKGILDRARYQDQMRALGYSDEYISWYLADM